MRAVEINKQFKHYQIVENNCSSFNRLIAE